MARVVPLCAMATASWSSVRPRRFSASTDLAPPQPPQQTPSTRLHRVVRCTHFTQPCRKRRGRGALGERECALFAGRPHQRLKNFLLVVRSTNCCATPSTCDNWLPLGDFGLTLMCECYVQAAPTQSKACFFSWARYRDAVSVSRVGNIGDDEFPKGHTVAGVPHWIRRALAHRHLGSTAGCPVTGGPDTGR